MIYFMTPTNQVCSRGRSRLPNSRPFQDPGSGQEPPPGQLRRDLRCSHLRSKLFEPAGCHGCVPAGGPGQPGQVVVMMRMMWVRIKMMIRILLSPGTIVNLGRIVLALSCNSFIAIQRENLAKSMELVTSNIFLLFLFSNNLFLFFLLFSLFFFFR